MYNTLYLPENYEQWREFYGIFHIIQTWVPDGLSLLKMAAKNRERAYYRYLHNVCLNTTKI